MGLDGSWMVLSGRYDIFIDAPGFPRPRAVWATSASVSAARAGNQHSALGAEMWCVVAYLVCSGPGIGMPRPLLSLLDGSD